MNNEFKKWIKNASLEELQEAYENERQNWIKNGAGDRTPIMNLLDNEISNRAEKAWENDPHRSKDPNHLWTDANRWE